MSYFHVTMYIALTQSIHWQLCSLASPKYIYNAFSDQDKDKYEPEPKVKNTEIYDETRESVADIGNKQCKDWYPQNNNEKVGDMR